MEDNEPEPPDDDNGYSSGELKIVEDEKQIGNKSQTKKRKRNSRKSESSDEEFETLPKDCVEIEEKLVSTAAKNRLTAANVKNILKRVVSNEHVLALVKIREEEMEEEEEREQIPSPKITRAKAKEMKRLKPQVSWPLPITPVKTQPVKVTSPEVTKLIAQDLPDEESDEEYQPNPDEEASDDERDTISSMSDADSQPRTPATPGQLSDTVDTTPTKWTEDGLFRIPKSTPFLPSKEEPTIALRTRSKLCLNDTPIEAIEQLFVPPDDDFDEDQIDNVWTDFLMEFSNPKTPTEPANEDDEEQDPEFNADHEQVDDEELWGDDEDIEVTRNEFNTLLTELYESMDAQFIAEFQDGVFEPTGPNINLIPTILQESHHVKTESPKKLLDISKSVPPENNFYENQNENHQNITNSPNLNIEPTAGKQISCTHNSNQEENNSTLVATKNVKESKDKLASINFTDTDFERDEKRKKNKRFKKIIKNGIATLNKEVPDWTFKEGDGILSEKQTEILNQQMRQHVQLVTQNYLQLYGHPKLWSMAPQQKEFLITLQLLAGDKPVSMFRPCNLLPAIELCNKWEEILSKNTKENTEYINDIDRQCEKSLMFMDPGIFKKRHKRFHMRFSDKLVTYMLNSKNVLLYPELLPLEPMRVDVKGSKASFTPSEDQLTAIGLEQFVQYANANPKLLPGNLDTTVQTKRKLMELITRYLVVGWTAEKLTRRVLEIRIGRLTTPENAVRHYIMTGKAPETTHTILPFEMNKKLIELDSSTMPLVWEKFCKEQKQKVLLAPYINRRKRKNGASKALCNVAQNISAKPIYNLTIENRALTQIVKPLQSEEYNTEFANTSDVKEIRSEVLIQFVDETGKEFYHNLGPILTPNSSSCETVQSLNTPIVSQFEYSQVDSGKNNQYNRSLESQRSNSLQKTPVRNKFNRTEYITNRFPIESSCLSSDDGFSYTTTLERSNDFTANNTNRNLVLQSSAVLQKSNRSAIRCLQCDCSCSSAHNSWLNEPLPKGQTLLTNYFQRLSKNSCQPVSYSEFNRDKTHKKETSKSTVLHSTSFILPNNGSFEKNHQSNCVDSSIPELFENTLKISNLHIYNRESYTLNTVFSKLNCLLFVNFQKRASHLSTHSNRLKSELAKAAKAKLLKEICKVGDTMLPSMPYLSTPSKSSFEDEYNETGQKNLPAELSKPACLDPGEKDTADLSITSTSKKVEDKLPANQGKTLSSKLNTSNQTSKVSVKATKAQKELEANKAMFATSDPFTDDLKDTTYATAFFDKVQERLTAKTDSELGERDDFFEFQNILSTFDTEKETPCDLYYKLEKLFGVENEDLTEEFLTFLTAGQAVQINRFMDHFLLTSMTDFIERLQIYFARRPTQLRKILWSLNQICDSMDSSNDQVSVERIKRMILPHLKGNQYLVNWFMRLFPTDRPPESLVNSGYEILDVEKLSKEMTSEEGSQMDKMDYEVINIPNVEDNYGTEFCLCECHNTSDEKYKNKSKHCMSCGMRYVQGRLYIPHGKGLRPGRVIWSNDEEARQQASRLGLLPSNRSATVLPTSGMNCGPIGSVVSSMSSPNVVSVTGNKRRAPSNEPQSLTRESDDERVSPKRTVRSVRTPTSKTKFSKLQLLKSSKNGDNEDIVKPGCSKSIIHDEKASQCLNKNDECEKLAEMLPQCDAENGNKNDSQVLKATAESANDQQSEPWIHDSIDIHEHIITKREVLSSDNDTEGMEDDTLTREAESQSIEETIKMKYEEHNWTRDEDKAILLVLQCESDLDFTFEKIRKHLPHRTLEEIKDRFHSVMRLLQQMASDK